MRKTCPTPTPDPIGAAVIVPIEDILAVQFSHAECTTALTNVSDALYVIGGKWKLRIIVALAEGPQRGSTGGGG